MKPWQRELGPAEVRAALDEAGPDASFTLVVHRPHPATAVVTQEMTVHGTVAELLAVLAPDADGILNPMPPEPPVGAKVTLSHRPHEVLYEHVEDGWVMPEWSEMGGRTRPHSWQYLVTTYAGALVLTREVDGG